MTDKKYQMSSECLYVDYYRLMPRYWHHRAEGLYTPYWKKRFPTDRRLLPGIHEGYRFRKLLPERIKKIQRMGPSDETDRYLLMMNKVGIDAFIWLVLSSGASLMTTEFSVSWPLDLRYYDTLGFLTVLGWHGLVDDKKVYRPTPLASFDGFLLWSAAEGKPIDPRTWLDLYNSPDSENLFMYSQPMAISASREQYSDYTAYLEAVERGGYAIRPKRLTIYLYTTLMRSRFFVDCYHAFSILESLYLRGLVRYVGDEIVPTMQPTREVGDLLADYVHRLHRNDTPGKETDSITHFIRAILSLRFPLLCGKCGGSAKWDGGSIWCIGCGRSAHFPGDDTDIFWMGAAFAEGRTLYMDKKSGKKRPCVLILDGKGAELCRFV